MPGISLFARTRQPTRRGHPPTPPRRVTVGQSEPSDPPVFPLPDTGGSVFSGTFGSRRLTEDSALPHLAVDQCVVLPAAVSRRPLGVEALVGAEQRMRRVLERLAARVEELGGEIDLIHARATAM